LLLLQLVRRLRTPIIPTLANRLLLLQLRLLLLRLRLLCRLLLLRLLLLPC
jgi:hypothetical protein